MGKRRGLTAVLATLVSLSLFAAPVMANPGKKEIRPRKTTVLPIIVKITANPITSSLTSVSRQRVIWR